jgi:hypothetical protein
VQKRDKFFISIILNIYVYFGISHLDAKPIFRKIVSGFLENGKIGRGDMKLKKFARWI